MYNLNEINLREGITGAGFLCGIFLGFLTKIICEKFCGIKNYLYLCKRNRNISKFIIKLKLKTLWRKLSKELFSLSYWLCGLLQSAQQIVCLKVGCSYWKCLCVAPLAVIAWLCKKGWLDDIDVEEWIWIRTYVFQRVVRFTIVVQDQSSRTELWIAVKSICVQSIAER